MRKVYKELTAEQKERGVIFSSQLMPNGSLHEVNVNDEDFSDRQEEIERLLNDKFFNNSPYKYNLIRR